MNELNQIKEIFDNYQVALSNEWLESCINWCKEENLNENYTVKELQLKVYEQWLLSDLRDVEIPSLPPNLSAQTKYTLTGNYSLQMQQIVDISKPKLWQLQKIRNNNISLAKTMDQENEFGKRVLQMTLTDGVQEIEAVEFKPISSLNVNLVPGAKVRLMGPVIVRRGRIMLEPHNIKMLGGEVDDLLIKNAAENILARSLKLPENPNPKSVDEKMFDSNTETSTLQQQLTGTTIHQQLTGTTIQQQITVDEQEELRIASEIDMLMEAERDLEPVFKKQSPPIRTPDIFEDDDDFAQLDLDAIESKSQLNNINSLDQLNKSTNGIFKVHAKFHSIVEKLTFTADKFNLVIKIVDETGTEATVKIHNNLISKFVGYTPEEIMKLKSGILEKDSGATAKMFKAIQALKDRLVVLDDLLEVHVNGIDEVPIVMNIL